MKKARGEARTTNGSVHGCETALLKFALSKETILHRGTRSNEKSCSFGLPTSCVPSHHLDITVACKSISSHPGSLLFPKHPSCQCPPSYSASQTVLRQPHFLPPPPLSLSSLCHRVSPSLLARTHANTVQSIHSLPPSVSPSLSLLASFVAAEEEYVLGCHRHRHRHSRNSLTPETSALPRCFSAVASYTALSPSSPIRRKAGRRTRPDRPTAVPSPPVVFSQ